MPNPFETPKTESTEEEFFRDRCPVCRTKQTNWRINVVPVNCKACKVRIAMTLPRRLRYVPLLCMLPAIIFASAPFILQHQGIRLTPLQTLGFFALAGAAIVGFMLPMIYKHSAIYPSCGRRLLPEDELRAFIAQQRARYRNETDSNR